GCACIARCRVANGGFAGGGGRRVTKGAARADEAAGRCTAPVILAGLGAAGAGAGRPPLAALAAGTTDGWGAIGARASCSGVSRTLRGAMGCPPRKVGVGTAVVATSRLR